MALIAPTISSLSCFASKNPKNHPKFLFSKSRSRVAYYSKSKQSSKTSKRSIPSYVYAPVSSHVNQFDHKTSTVCTYMLYF